MPCKNNHEYLMEAVNSIFRMDYDMWELIIIDDASDPPIFNFLQDVKDPRVSIYRLDTSRGISHALNYGLLRCKGKYVARFDSDDIIMSDRLEYQVNFLEEHQAVGVLSGLALTLGESKERIIGDEYFGLDIGAKLAIKNFIIHPTVMIKKEVLINNNIKYNMDYKNAEDYELWSQMLPITKFANLPKVFIKYRIHANSQSALGKLDQVALSILVQKNIIKNSRKKFFIFFPAYFFLFKKSFYYITFRSKFVRKKIDSYRNKIL